MVHYPVLFRIEFLYFFILYFFILYVLVYKTISCINRILIYGHGIIHHHHHHHVVPPARISLTLSRHFSLSFISFGRSSGLHPVSSHSCSMYVRAGRPAFAWPYVGVHRSTSLMSSSSLASPAVSCVSGSSNLYSFRDGRQVAV